MPIEIVDKEIGETCLECSNRFFQERKKAYAGRLDPMARGKLLILTEDDVKQQSKFLKHNKTYQFTIVCGIKTDSDDVLGVIESVNRSKMNSEQIINMITEHKKTFEQEYHIYSSFRPKEYLDGKRKALWYWTQNNKRPSEMPKKEVSILSNRFLKKVSIVSDDLRKNILGRLSKLTNSGNFKKEKIIEQWKEFDFFDTRLLTFEVEVTSGFYIRQFVKDISCKLDYPLIVLDINRTKIDL